MRRLLTMVMAAIAAVAYVIDWVVDAAGRMVRTMRRHATGYGGPDPAALAAAEQADKEADLDGKQTMSADAIDRQNDNKLHAVDQAADLLRLAKCIAGRQITKIALIDREDTRLWLRDMLPEEGALLMRASSEQLLAIATDGPSACRILGVRVPPAADPQFAEGKAATGAVLFQRECITQSRLIFRAAQCIHGGKKPDLSAIAREDTRHWLSSMPMADAYSLALAADSHRITIAALGPSACRIAGVYAPPPSDAVKPYRAVYKHCPDAPPKAVAPVNDGGGVSDLMAWVKQPPRAF